MTDIEKFHTDVRKAVKHNRASNNGSCNWEEICSDVINLFVSESSSTPALARSVAEYWRETYINTSKEQEDESVLKNIDKLGAMLAFLEGSDEDSDLLSKADWSELAEMVNYEAVDMPVEILHTLMSVLVSKGAV